MKSTGTLWYNGCMDRRYTVTVPSRYAASPSMVASAEGDYGITIVTLAILLSGDIEVGCDTVVDLEVLIENVCGGDEEACAAIMATLR